MIEHGDSPSPRPASLSLDLYNHDNLASLMHTGSGSGSPD